MANPFKSSVSLIMCQRKDNSAILSLPLAKLKIKLIYCTNIIQINIFCASLNTDKLEKIRLKH